MPIHPRRHPKRLAGPLATALALNLALALGGCAAQLAPSYDQNLVDGLNQVNRHSMRLMATVSGGAARETFTWREGQYNDVIGEVDALSHLVQARPMPRSGVVGALRKTFSSLPEQPRVAPTLSALGNLSTTLARMKGEDQKAGLSATKVRLYKGQVDISLSQVLGFESFLAP